VTLTSATPLASTPGVWRSPAVVLTCRPAHKVGESEQQPKKKSNLYVFLSICLSFFLSLIRKKKQKKKLNLCLSVYLSLFLSVFNKGEKKQKKKLWQLSQRDSPSSTSSIDFNWKLWRRRKWMGQRQLSWQEISRYSDVIKTIVVDQIWCNRLRRISPLAKQQSAQHLNRAEGYQLDVLAAVSSDLKSMKCHLRRRIPVFETTFKVISSRFLIINS